ncbi:MAG: type II secretion system protein [Candidatus Rokubacteria bacterium]|nr:type II secretion system protein [Candidatus Rokubacteria bacterium]
MIERVRALIRNERGLTLAEILAAVAVIGIGLVGLAVVIPIASYGLQEGNQLSTATFLAEQRLEQVKNAVWQASAPTNDCIGVSANATAAPTVPYAGGDSCNGAAATTFPDEANVPGYTGYARNVRVTDCGVGAGCGLVVHSDMRLVTVTVTYRPLTAAGQTTTNKSAVVSLLVAKR